MRPAPTRSLPRLSLLVAFVVLTACGSPGTENTSPPGLTPIEALGTDAPPAPELDPRQVAIGAGLYRQHCAVCHDEDLSGDPDWMIPNEDGSYPPPPHDDTGHTWHHPDRLIQEIIRNGQPDFPESRMPAFGDVLTDDDIAAILEFLKSHWGPEERGFQWEVTWRDQQSG